MKKLRIDSILFIAIITILGIVNLLNFNKPTVSELENRALKEKPEFSIQELLGGTYLTDFEEYYSDTFISRDKLVRANRDLRTAMNFLGSGISIVTGYDDIDLINEPGGNEPAPTSSEPKFTDPVPTKPGESTPTKPAETTETVPPTTVPPTTVKPDFGDGPNVGYWLVIDGKAVQLFKFDKESFDYYSQILNKYSEKLGDEVKIYSMIPPTASEFLKLKKYAGITDSQNDALGYLQSILDEDIISVNVYDALNKHKDEYTYFRTDHHWTALGAYYGYEAFMNTIGEEPIPLDQYEAKNLGDFLGSSYTKTLDKNLEKNPDTLTVYMPFTDYEYLYYDGNKELVRDVIDLKWADNVTNKYLTFISTGGATWSVIKTDVKNGKKIMVIKDSFGNAIVPFLLPHYEEIYVIDPRFYSIYITGKDIVKLAKEKEITEMLFVIYMEDVNWDTFMRSVENLLGD